MLSAYIMMKLHVGKDEEVFAKIEKLKEIKEANATYGAFDLVMKVEFKNIEELDRFIFEEVRRIPGVSETSSMIVAKEII